MTQTLFPLDFADFYSYAGRTVRGYANKCFRNYFPQAEIEDMVSEVVEKMLCARDRFDPAKGTLFAWVWPIAKNTVKTHAQHRKVRSDLLFDNDGPDRDHLLDSIAADGDAAYADLALLYEELETDLFSRLSSERDRRFLSWKISGMGAEEMALRSGVSVNNVYVILSRIREKLHRAA